MDKIHVPSLDARRYAETFAVFVEHSLEYPQMLGELLQVASSHVHEGFRLLDIGAGTGHVIQSFMQRSSIRPSRYLAFEPNPRHQEQLTGVLRTLGLDFQIRPEPYTLDTRLDEEFDLALFSHSLYWMTNPGLHMLKATSCLSGGGVALAFIGGPYGVHAMFPLFEPQIERTTPMLQNNAISSHEVVQELRSHGRWPTIKFMPTPIDLTGLFEEPGHNELSEFISFCMQLEFALLPDWLKEDMIQYIRGGCVEQNGRLYWYLPTCAILLTA